MGKTLRVHGMHHNNNLYDTMQFRKPNKNALAFCGTTPPQMLKPSCSASVMSYRKKNALFGDSI